MCQFVPNFLSYVSAKYYLNWFTVGKVITKIKSALFTETQCSNSNLFILHGTVAEGEVDIRSTDSFPVRSQCCLLKTTATRANLLK